MRKALSITMLALLVAGVASMTYATSSWSGSANGNCGGHPILVNWVGDLDTDEPDIGFNGYWHSDEDNRMYGAAEEWDTDVWDVYDGYWNSGGEAHYYVGDWAARFNEDTETMSGFWDSDDVICNTGSLWGTMDE